MKKVVVMSKESPSSVVGEGEFEVHRFDVLRYVEERHLYSIYDIDRLWRSEERRYMDMLDAFLVRHAEADIVIVNGINAFHPEWIHDNLPHTVKIWGCIDDPVASYQRTAACVWAYDGAFYISPGYARGRSMAEALRLWGVEHTHWFPLSGDFWNSATPAIRDTSVHRSRILASLQTRRNGVVYVGKLYASKFDRLATMKASLGSDMSLYGRWPLAGYAGFVAPARGHRFMPHRVRALTSAEREEVYLSHRIGLNLHYSEQRETGNVRMYEAPYFGLMLLCDKAANAAHANIFEPDVEAVYYESTEEAVALAQRYLRDDAARMRIARAGFERVCSQYDGEKCFVALLRWAASVPRRRRDAYTRAMT